jgi:hypothetical protein
VVAALTEAGLLGTWEAGLGRDPVRRAMALATAGGAEPLSVADLSIGRRAEFVLALRESCFGTAFSCAVTCPDCGEELELELTMDELRAAGPAEPENRITVDGVEVEFRPVTSRDLLAVSRERADARRLLIERCVVSARRRGRKVAKLPDSVLSAVAAGLAAGDPQADVLLALDCATCGHEWSSPFDIAAYLWTEMEAYAHRLLYDVHALAGAYGWSEAEILAVSPARRRCYLGMVGQ